MKRAALLIGVQQAGALTRLQAVLDGVRAMNDWASAQQFATIEVVTDETGSVALSDVTAAVARILSAGPDQLIVYFAGHGINKVYSEYWLLSGAPDWPAEAVNVTASAELARRCGVPHVVFVSDACRTSPDGIGAQAVTGAPIFPNVAGARPGSVDQFFATRVGEPAFEIADERSAAARFTSAFTDVVTRSLNGMYTELLEDQPDEPGKMVLRPWPLNRALPDLLLDELERLGVDLTINQQPDALINSDPAEAWLSKVSAKRSFTLNPPIPTPPTLAEQIGELVATGVADLTEGTALGGSPTFDWGTAGADATGGGADALDFDWPIVDWTTVEPGALGVRVYGAQITASTVSDSAVFIELDGQYCTNLPRIAGADCCVLIDDTNMVSVHWQSAGARQPDSGEALRRALAAASNAGLLRLDPVQARQVLTHFAERDRAVELYLAYAQRPEAIDEDDCFDTGLLCDNAAVTTTDGTARWPGFPKLSRGFGLLQAQPASAESEPALAVAQTLRDHVLPSHWSLFGLGARDLLLQLLHTTSQP